MAIQGKKLFTGLSWHPISNLFRNHKAFTDNPPPIDVVYWVTEDGDYMATEDGDYLMWDNTP